MPGKEINETARVSFRTNPGDYLLAVGLFTDKKLKSPDILLGIETHVIERWHILSNISIR